VAHETGTTPPLQGVALPPCVETGLPPTSAKAGDVVGPVGIPVDGQWEHDAAYDQRYCYNYGEPEYLL
jgi:hypothetical protein